MKLLMVLPNFPSPTWGGGTGNYHLLKTLATKYTVSLLSSSEVRTSFGVAGRRLVEAEYSWERCGDMLLHTLEKLS
jgi:hypothetical protein